MATITWRAAMVTLLAVVGLWQPRVALAQTSQWVAVCPTRAIRALEVQALVDEDFLTGSGQLPAQDPQLEQPTEQEKATLQVEKRRRVSRSYAVPAGGRAFSLHTRYGRVQVNPWNKKEIKVEAELVARSESEAGARLVLDALGVQWLDYDAKTGGVAVSTLFGPLLRGRAGGCRYEVNYTVWLPRTTALALYNNFGEIAINGDLSGPTELVVEYGTLRTGRLEGPQNLVRIGNGNCTIPFAGQANIDASYAQLRLDQGSEVVLRNNHSDVDIGTVEDLTIYSKYGDVALGTVRNLRGSSGYSRFTVDKLGQGLDMALRYCPDFVVRDMGPNFRQVNLDGGYSSIRLGFAESPSFRFDVSTEQGQLLVDKGMVRVLSQENGPITSDVLGTFGSTTPTRHAGNVNIKVRYGTVRFSK